MPHLDLTAMLKTNKLCAFNLAGGVGCAGISTKTVSLHTHDKRWRTNRMER